MMRSAGFVILALCCFSLHCTSARPWSEEHPETGDDPNAKYEVYVPDSTGQMSPQMMTLPEIRGLLARQGAEDEPMAALPLDGANADDETPSDPTVDVADVVSSVQTIVAEEIAQREQVDKEEPEQVEQPAANEDDSVFVVMAVDGQDETVVDVKPLSDEKEAQPEYVHIINVAGENLAPGETVEEAEKVEDVPNETAESQDVEEAQVVEEADQVSLMEEEVDVSEPTNVLDEQHTEVARSDLSQEEAEEEEEEEVEDEVENREAAEDDETEEDDEAIERIDVVDDEEEESEDEAEERDNDEEEEEEEIEENDAEESTARFLDVEDDETSVVDDTLDQLVKPVSYQSQLGEHHHDEHHHDDHHHHHDDVPTAVFGPVPEGNSGLAATSKDQDKELRDLTCASNKLAWKVWKNSVNERSVESNDVFSPLALTSALGIAFLGSRGSTAETIDTALGLDRLTTKNPHLHLQQVARDLDASEYFNSQQTHVLFANESLGPLNDIFQARVDTLYGAATARNGDDLKKQLPLAASSFAKSSLSEAMQKDADVSVSSPFSVLSMAQLKVDWPSTSPSGDDQEEFMNFLNLPSAAQVSGRRLARVSTVQTNGSFYAGYDPKMDATVVALPLYPVQEGREEQYFSFEPSNATKESLDDAGHLSLVLVMPGSASQFQAGGSGLAALESRLAQDPEGWNSLLKHTTRRHLHVKFPQLAKESHLNLGRALMGVQTSSNPSDSPSNLANLFDPEAADFSAISSRKPLYLSDISQMVELTINSVATQPDDEQLGRMNKNQPAGAAKKKTGTRAHTCPHSAVKKASGKKPAANKQTQKAPAKVAGQKVQVKPGQKAPAKNGGQKKPANQKSPSKVTPKKPAATTRPISGNLPGKKTTSTNSKVGAASKPKAKPKPTNKQPANKKPTAAKPSNKKPVATNKRPTAAANNKKPTTAATNKRPAPAKKPAATGKKPVAAAGKPATANKNQAKPATGAKAPANKPKPATGAKAPAKKPKPATSAAKVPANKPKPVTGVKAPANKPKPATGAKAPANKPKPVASGAKAPANKPKPVASGVKAPANKPKPATGAKAPANKPKPATGVKAPANKPKPVASGAKAPANKPKPVTGAKAPANKPKPVASGAKAPANKPKPVASGAKAPANKPKPVVAKVPANKPKPAGAKAPVKKPVAANAKAPAANKPQANAGAKRPAQTKPKAPAKSPAPTLAKVAGCKNKTTAAQKQPQTPAKTVPTNAKNQHANKPVANNNRKTQSHRQTREAPELPVTVTEVEQQIPIADDDFQRLVINRAFIYAVRHNPTGLLTMIGRYVHP